MENDWECLVVGGGAAGLSAALVLGRARRRTLLVDAGRQSNLAAKGIGGLLGHDGRPATELYELSRKELQQYPSVEVRSGEVRTAQRRDGGFDIELADGSHERVKRVLLAMGMEYRPPPLPGLDELWGGSVFHCPFCHGWEVREQPLAVLAQGERAMHMARLLRGWSDDVIVLTNGTEDLTEETRDCLRASEVPVDERPIERLASVDGELEAIVFTDGSRLARRGLLVAATLHQRTDLATQLGLNCVEPGPMQAVEVDALYQTSAPGVFAAGDVCTQMPQVAAAVAAGSAAAASMVRSLMEEI